MIKFFRHIRKEQMETGKTGKYLKYAIGEIVLVMIGILLALQVNNWNEERITKNKEIEILKDFKTNLDFDIAQLDSIIHHYKRAKKSINTVLNNLENDLPYTDSLSKLFFNTTLIYDSGGLTSGVFENLKSSGFDIISNKEIRSMIILVYEENNPWMKSWEERYINLIFDAQKNIYNTRFKDFWNGDYKDQNVIGEMIPIDYEKLKNDDEYKYLLRTQLNLIDWLINKPVENTQIECKKLLKIIKKKLDKSN
jgi:Family of unknown function (DUF6090)